MKKSQNEIAVIVPIYNGLNSLEPLVSRLHHSLSGISENYQIILVDDQGREPVWPVISSLSKEDPRVVGLRLSRNFGQHPAISAGLHYAHAKWYVVMDGDLQDLPEAIPDLYEHALRNQSDTVIARRVRENVSKSKKLGSRLFNTILEKLADLPASSEVGNFRIFNQSMALAFHQYKENMRLFPAIMGHTGFKVDYLDVERPARDEGESSYTFKKLFELAFDAIISNSIKPMYYLAGFGVLVSFLSFALAISLVGRKLIYGIDVDGWASLMTAVIFMGGIQIFVISFVGIYVGKVFFEVKKRPHFIVAEKTMDVPSFASLTQ